MRRWNGWGDDATIFELPTRAKAMLAQLVGEATPPSDVALGEVVAKVPASRLPVHPLVNLDPETRLRHSRGQSLPDWIALRTGTIETFPDGVASPRDDAEVRDLIQYCREVGAQLIPYGGGTSVLGHVTPLAGEAPTLTVDLGEHLSDLRQLDVNAHLATFGAGVAGPGLEAALRERGFTLGHYPQSFELSTLGGWVVTRSAGQQSLHYGRIEDVFMGGRLESPEGSLEMLSVPASAAGPDLREMVLGSEGRFGVLTEATVQVSPLPENEEFHAVFFPDWERALAACRDMAQARLPLSMLRLSTPVETATTLALAGHRWIVAGLERLLSIRGIGAEKCMLLIGVTGGRALTRAALLDALGIADSANGWHLGQSMGKAWHRNRFHAPYARNTLWEAGYAVDTLETAIDWTGVGALVEAIESALRSALAEEGERAHVFTHLSHLYPTGSNIYTSYIFRIAATPEATLDRWRRLKRAASRVIVEHRGTISHQHGVGTDHAEYLAAETGDLGVAAVRDLCRRFDPEGIMNPGKLVP